MRIMAVFGAIALASVTACSHPSPDSGQAQKLAQFLYSSDMTADGVPNGTAWQCTPQGSSRYQCDASGYAQYLITLPPGWVPGQTFWIGPRGS